MLWLLPGKGKETSKTEGAAERAGAGDCVGVTREREGQSPEGGAGTSETAGSMADFLFKLVAVVN